MFNLLETELDIPVYLEPEFQKERMKQGRYLRIWPEASEHLDYVAEGEYRRYPFNIYFYDDIKKYRKSDIWGKVHSDIIAHITRFVNTYSHYSPSDIDNIELSFDGGDWLRSPIM